jgi:hypothetical protein
MRGTPIPVDLSGLDADTVEKINTGSDVVKPIPAGLYVMKVASVKNVVKDEQSKSSLLVCLKVVCKAPSYRDLDNFSLDGTLPTLDRDLADSPVFEHIRYANPNCKAVTATFMQRVAGITPGGTVNVVPESMVGRYTLAKVSLTESEQYGNKNEIGFGYQFLPPEMIELLGLPDGSYSTAHATTKQAATKVTPAPTTTATEPPEPEQLGTGLSAPLADQEASNESGSAAPSGDSDLPF